RTIAWYVVTSSGGGEWARLLIACQSWRCQAARYRSATWLACGDPLAPARNTAAVTAPAATIATSAAIQSQNADRRRISARLPSVQRRGAPSARARRPVRYDALRTGAVSTCELWETIFSCTVSGRAVRRSRLVEPAATWA